MLLLEWGESFLIKKFSAHSCQRRFKGAADAIRKSSSHVRRQSFLLRASSSEWNKLGDVEMRIWEKLEFVSIYFSARGGSIAVSTKAHRNNNVTTHLDFHSKCSQWYLWSYTKFILKCHRLSDAFARRLNEAGGVLVVATFLTDARVAS